MRNSNITFRNTLTSRRSWCNGITQVSHVRDTGSTPGVRICCMLACTSSIFISSPRFLRQSNTLVDFRGPLAPLQQLCSQDFFFLIFSFFFFFFFFLLPGTFKVLSPEQARIALFRINTVGRCQEENKKLMEVSTAHCMLSLGRLEHTVHL